MKTPGEVEKIVSTSAPEVETAVMVGFRHRLKLVLGDRSVNAFATLCNMSGTLLRKYLAGSVPGLDKVATIAAMAGVSFQWLATGEGQMHPDGVQELPNNYVVTGFNEQLLIDVVVAIENVIKNQKLSIIPEKKGRLIALVYSYYQTIDEKQVDMANVIRFVDIAK